MEFQINKKVNYSLIKISIIIGKPDGRGWGYAISSAEETVFAQYKFLKF